MIDPAAVLRSRNLWLAAFAVLATAQPVFVLIGASLASVMATWVLVIPLAIWVWRTRGPRLLLVALGLCWVGDVFGNPRQLGLGPGVVVVSAVAYLGAAICLAVVVVRCRAVLGYIGGAVFVCWLLLVGLEVAGVVHGTGLAFRVGAPAVYALGLGLIAVGVVLSRPPGADRGSPRA